MKGFCGIFLLVLVLATGCSKTPKHIIEEDAMTRILVDMYKAEAVMEQEEKTFYNDSTKKRLRQSVFMKHNVTQELYDTSLIWYAHNLDVYKTICDEVVKELEAENKELTKGDFTVVSSITSSSDIEPSKPRFREVGDTADIWGKSRTWFLLPGFSENMITFDLKPDKENMLGDVYELAFKTCNTRKSLQVFMGVDYKDGSTAYQQRTYNVNGWNRCVLQSDSTREVKRIYGYLNYEPTSFQIAYLDSVELLRTHLDRNQYNKLMRKQKWIIDKKIDTRSKDAIKKELSEEKELVAEEPKKKKVKEIKLNKEVYPDK